MATQNVFSGSVVSSAVGSIGFSSVAGLLDLAAGLTAAQILGGFFTITPTANRILTLPTAVVLAAAVKSPLVVGSVIEFTIQNLATLASGFNPVLAVAAGITDGGIASQLQVAGSSFAGPSGAGTFALLCTANTAGAETFTLYRKS